MKSMHGDVADFEGVILQRDDTGFGIVEFQSPESLKSKLGIFTMEVVHSPEVSRACTVKSKVKGRTKIVNKDGFRIVHMTPLSWKHGRP